MKEQHCPGSKEQIQCVYALPAMCVQAEQSTASKLLTAKFSDRIANHRTRVATKAAL